MLASTIATTGISEPILTQQSGIIPADLEYENLDNTELRRKALGHILSTTTGDALERRFFSFNFVGPVVAAAEVDWNGEVAIGQRRLIHKDEININESMLDHHIQSRNPSTQQCMPTGCDCHGVILIYGLFLILYRLV